MRKRSMYDKTQYFICTSTVINSSQLHGAVIEGNFYTKQEIRRMINSNTTIEFITDTFKAVWIISGFTSCGIRTGAKWCNKLHYDYKELLE